MAVVLTEADLSAKENGFRFIAATWGSEPADTFKGETCMSSPEELIDTISNC